MKLPKITLPYIVEVIRPAALDEVLAIPESASLAINGNFDRIGAFTTRYGTTTLGSEIVASSNISGLHNYINATGSTSRLFAMVGTAVYSYNGSSWSSVRSSLTAFSKARFTTLADYAFMVNGTGNEVVRSSNGGSFSTTYCTDLQKGDFIENYRSRLWIGQSTTDRIYYSNVVTTAGTITGGTSYIAISPQDGDKMTGLKRDKGALLVFKRNHIYRVSSINSVDADPFITIGSYSQESIVEGKDGIYFHHPSGFYLLQSGSQPLELSTKIRDIVSAISRANYDNIGAWFTNDNVYWSVGDIILDGVTLTNIVCRYTISTQRWTISSYPIFFKVGCKYDDGTSITNVVGGNSGKVYAFDSGNTDDGTPIFYDLQTQWYYLTAQKSDWKCISALNCLHENAQGASISYLLDVDSSNSWKPIGSIQEDLAQCYSVNTGNFTRIKFRIQGNNTGTPFIYRGLELINLETSER